MNLSSAVLRISPDAAKEMLKSALFRNRHSQETIDELASEMKEGRWVVNGQPIIYNDGGKLVDGQRRLLALIQSGTTQYFFVVYGVSDQSVTTIDKGRRRNFIDKLAERSMPNLFLIYGGVSLYLRRNQQKATRIAIGNFIEKTEVDLQELANFSRKSMIVNRIIPDKVIFAYALEHGIAETCSQIRKLTGNDKISKLRGIHKLIAFSKL